MRVYFTPARLWTGGVLTRIAPDSVEAQTSAGALVQAGLAAVSDGDEYYVDTTDGLFSHHVKYRLLIRSTVAGTAVSRYKSFRHVTVTGAVPDTTPPGSAGIGVPTMGNTTASLPHTAPTDSDYAQTTVFAVPENGGTIVTATGSGTTISLTGLEAGIRYFFIAVAYDTSGNASTIGVNSVQVGVTLADDPPDLRAWAKWWTNDQATIHAYGPRAFDPALRQSIRISPLGRGRHLRFRIECHDPVATFQVRGIGFRVVTRRQGLGGLRDTRGD